MFGHSDQGEGNGIDKISQVVHRQPVNYTISGISRKGGFNIVVEVRARDQEDRDLTNNRVSLTESQLRGDVNLDGETSFVDFLLLSANYGKEGAVRSDGDLNDDAFVSFEDFLILADDFGMTIGP